MERSHLRPVERAIRRLADTGMSSTDIAWRFRRTPGYVDQVLRLSALPGRSHSANPPQMLRPIERCVLRARDNGAEATEIAARLRRTPAHVERIATYATYKQDKHGQTGGRST